MWAINCLYFKASDIFMVGVRYHQKEMLKSLLVNGYILSENETSFPHHTIAHLLSFVVLNAALYTYGYQPSKRFITTCYIITTYFIYHRLNTGWTYHHYLPPLHKEVWATLWQSTSLIHIHRKLTDVITSDFDLRMASMLWGQHKPECRVYWKFRKISVDVATLTSQFICVLW